MPTGFLIDRKSAVAAEIKKRIRIYIFTERLHTAGVLSTVNTVKRSKIYASANVQLLIEKRMHTHIHTSIHLSFSCSSSSSQTPPARFVCRCGKLVTVARGRRRRRGTHAGRNRRECERSVKKYVRRLGGVRSALLAVCHDVVLLWNTRMHMYTCICRITCTRHRLYEARGDRTLLSRYLLAFASICEPASLLQSWTRELANYTDSNGSIAYKCSVSVTLGFIHK